VASEGMAGFVLASRSPRRRELLAAAGLFPDVDPVDVDESPRPGETPERYVVRVAQDKVEASKRKGPVLAADTTVVLDGRSLGKAEDADHARQILSELSGRTHLVRTAVVLKADRLLWDVVATAVTFRNLTDADIARYIETDEPFDKAGAYGIQGGGGSLIERVEGSYTNVVGLPLTETLRILRMAEVV